MYAQNNNGNKNNSSFITNILTDTFCNKCKPAAHQCGILVTMLHLQFDNK